MSREVIQRSRVFRRVDRVPSGGAAILVYRSYQVSSSVIPVFHQTVALTLRHDPASTGSSGAIEFRSSQCHQTVSRATNGSRRKHPMFVRHFDFVLDPKDEDTILCSPQLHAEVLPCGFNDIASGIKHHGVVVTAHQHVMEKEIGLFARQRYPCAQRRHNQAVAIQRQTDGALTSVAVPLCYRGAMAVCGLHCSSELQHSHSSLAPPLRTHGVPHERRHLLRRHLRQAMRVVVICHVVRLSVSSGQPAACASSAAD